MASEIDRLDPAPNNVALQSGFQVEIVRLKSRQFFRLLRILTHGAGAALLRSDLNFGSSQEEFLGRLLSLVVLAIPDAENEAIDFIQSMCKPVGLKDLPLSQLTKQDAENNERLWTDLGAELHNPELEDIIDILEAIVQAEAADIQSLGKRLQKLLELAQRTGQTEPGEPTETPEPSELNSQESRSEGRSPQSSTPSAASTAGRTKPSSTSRSAGSARSQTALAGAGTGKPGTGES